MSGLRAAFTPPPRSAFENFRRLSRERIERAALEASDEGGKAALREVRTAMALARLGRLGQAIATNSDLSRNGRVFKTPFGFSASANLHIRSGSPRSRGTIEAYTQGAEIRPVKGRWLWIATAEIQSKVGKGRFKSRVTPELYNRFGLDKSIGPLVQITGINGNPLLIVRDASVSAAGVRGKARSRTKSGRLRAGQRAKDTIVAFIGIPRTSRAARINVNAIMRQQQQRLPLRTLQRLEREGR